MRPSLQCDGQRCARVDVRCMGIMPRTYAAISKHISKHSHFPCGLSLYIYIVGFILVSEPVFFLSWHEHCSCHHHGLPPPVQRRSGVHLRKRGEFYVDNWPAVC